MVVHCAVHTVSPIPFRTGSKQLALSCHSMEKATKDQVLGTTLSRESITRRAALAAIGGYGSPRH